jgi:dodecin
MPDHVYRIIQVAGSSEKSIEDAIQNAVGRASRTLRQVGWFDVVETRGHIEDGKVAHYQVTLKVGFTRELAAGVFGARHLIPFHRCAIRGNLAPPYRRTHARRRRLTRELAAGVFSPRHLIPFHQCAIRGNLGSLSSDSRTRVWGRPQRAP